MNKYEYTPTTWIGGKTIGTADVMNNIEEGIMKAHEELEEVNSQLEHIENKKTSYWIEDFGGVGDGKTDNSNAFALAMSKLKNGDTLLIGDGIYLITESIVIEKPINIKGINCNVSKIKFSTNATGYHSSLINNLTEFYNEIVDIQLDESRSERNGLDYQDFPAIHTSSNTLINRVEILNTFGPGIGNATTVCENVDITNCHIHDTAHHCIYFGGDYLNNISITNNKLKTNAVFEGRRYNSNIIKFRFKKTNTTYEGINISNNEIDKPSNPSTITNTGVAIYMSNQGDDEVQVSQLNNFTVRANTFNKNNETGSYNVLRIESGVSSKNILISENIINNDYDNKTTVFGLSYIEGENIFITDNIIYNCYDGILCKNAIVKNNYINYTSNGIVSENSHVYNNIINMVDSVTDSGYAIDVTESNVCFNNINGNALSNIAMRIGTNNNKRITNNTIRNCNYGLSKSFSSGVIINNCVIDSNLFENITSSNYRNIINNLYQDRDNYIESMYKDRYSSTTNRPSGTYISERYYDTTLKKPLWWDGSNWRDASGAIV